MMKKVFAAALMLVMLMTAVGAGAEVMIRDLLGVVDGDEYENEAMGIAFRAPGWKMYTQEEIIALNRLGVEKLGSDAQKMLDEADALQVMVASLPGSMNNVNIIVTNLGDGVEYIKAQSVEEMLESNRDNLRSLMENAGATDVQIGIADFPVGGHMMTGVWMEYNLMGYHFVGYQVDYYQDVYMITITITGESQEDAERIFDCFSWL